MPPRDPITPGGLRARVRQSVGVAVGLGLASGETVGDGSDDGPPATAEAYGSGVRDGTPERVGTGEADGVDAGAPPACSVQLVPSHVQVSPITSPAAEVDPRSSPPTSRAGPVGRS